jgi:predicted TIM-barrel fold metal-dependent hydrolase
VIFAQSGDPVLNKAIISLVLLMSVSAYGDNDSAPFAPQFADIHLHFNWDQKEIISAQTVVERLQKNNVVLALVMGVPSELALELADAGGAWIKPFFSPYLTPAHRNYWSVDDKVLDEAQKALASRAYKGIGEVHLWSDLGPRRDNRIFNGLIQLAQRYDVPFMIHTEASSHEFFRPICQQYPRVKFMWAHAGSKLNAQQVGALLEQCPNVWPEVSVRDPWRYHSLVDDDGRLLPGWRELMIKYQDRFMTGTDPVWGVTRGQRWDEPDEGWDHYDELLQFHRDWLRQLPPEVERKIRLDNARAFLTGAD